MQPYNALQYADQQKDVTVSGLKARMMTAVQELTAQLGEDTYEFENYMSKVGPRIQHKYGDTLMLAGTPFVMKLLVDKYVALLLHLSCSFYSNMYIFAFVAAVLDPESHYSFAFDQDPAYINKLLDVIAKMAATPQSGEKAMDELVFYNANTGKFGGVMAQLAARTSSPG